jgi:hypothetical protein
VGRFLRGGWPGRRLTGSAIYDAGMLVGLANRASRAQAEHLAIIRHTRPIVPGPVLSQAWRRHSPGQAILSRYLKDCRVGSSSLVGWSLLAILGGREGSGDGGGEVRRGDAGPGSGGWSEWAARVPAGGMRPAGRSGSWQGC